MKNSHAIIASIVYWDDLDYNKYFYWDGAQLQKVSKDKVISIFNNIWGSRIHQLSIQYPEEYAAINKPLEFKMSPEISERVKEVKNIASELQDPVVFTPALGNLVLPLEKCVKSPPMIKSK